MYFFCTPRKRAYCVLSTLIDFFLVAGAFQIHRVKGLSSYLYTLFVIFLVAECLYTAVITKYFLQTQINMLS